MHGEAGAYFEAVVVEDLVGVGDPEHPPVDFTRYQGGDRESLVAEIDGPGDLVGRRTVRVEKIEADLIAILEAEHHLGPPHVDAAGEAEIPFGVQTGTQGARGGVVRIHLELCFCVRRPVDAPDVKTVRDRARGDRMLARRQRGPRAGVLAREGRGGSKGEDRSRGGREPYSHAT